MAKKDKDNVESIVSPIVPVEPPNYEARSPLDGLAREEVVPDSVERSLKECGLDWEVKTQPVYLVDKRQVPDRRAVLRFDPGDTVGRIIGTAGKLFTPIQNLDAFSTLQPAIDEFGATIETAGAQGDGDRVWMLLKLPQKGSGYVGRGDGIIPYFLVSNAHTSEKSQSLQARFTSVRVWCANMLDAAIKGGRAAIAIPHHKNSAERLKEIGEVVARMYEVHHGSIKIYQQMVSVKITADEAYQYLQQVFRLRNADEDRKMTRQLSKAGAQEHEGRLSKVFDAREQTMWLVDNGKGTGRTAYGAYMAVTEYIDHVSILKKGGGLTKNGFETAAFGYGAYQKQKAFDLAVERWGKAA